MRHRKSQVCGTGFEVIHKAGDRAVDNGPSYVSSELASGSRTKASDTSAAELTTR